MDLSALSLSVDSIFAMGLLVVTAYAGIWSVRKVISLARDSGKTYSGNDPGGDPLGGPRGY